MSNAGGRVSKRHYNEDGLRVGRDQTHLDRLNEKHLRGALHRKCFDIVEDDVDPNPHWLYQEDD